MSQSKPVYCVDVPITTDERANLERFNDGSLIIMLNKLTSSTEAIDGDFVEVNTSVDIADDEDPKLTYDALLMTLFKATSLISNYMTDPVPLTVTGLSTGTNRLRVMVVQSGGS